MKALVTTTRKPARCITTVENNFFGKALVEGCAIAAPCRAKVAEQLLEISTKAGIVGVAGATLKNVADKMAPDELDHLITLKMMDNDDITEKYLSWLQDKYAPSHTGNNDSQVDIGSHHTGNNNSQANTGPNHTDNNQNSGQSAINTGNTEGALDTGGNTTVTQIPDGPNKDDLAYLAGGYEPNKGAVGNMGEFFKQPGFGSVVKDNTQKTNQQYQGQSIYKATDNVSDYLKKGDRFYLDGLHRDHIEVFDKRGNFRAVLNLDGSINERKTQEAEGRKLK